MALPSGRFVSPPSGSTPAPPLVIKSGIRVVGKGQGTVLCFSVSVDEGARGRLLELSHFCVKGAPLLVSGAALERV